MEKPNKIFSLYAYPPNVQASPFDPTSNGKFFAYQTKEKRFSNLTNVVADISYTSLVDSEVFPMGYAAVRVAQRVLLKTTSGEIFEWDIQRVSLEEIECASGNQGYSIYGTEGYITGFDEYEDAKEYILEHQFDGRPLMIAHRIGWFEWN